MNESNDKLPSLETLQTMIDSSKKEGATDDGKPTPADVGKSMRLSVELMSGVGVGGVLGFMLDRWLGTSPWLFVVFFFIGAAAGFRNLMREVKDEKLE